MEEAATIGSARASAPAGVSVRLDAVSKQFGSSVSGLSTADERGTSVAATVSPAV